MLVWNELCLPLSVRVAQLRYAPAGLPPPELIASAQRARVTGRQA
jgi:hypothetical protein